MSFTRQDVAANNTAKSAWIVIDTVVYDITKFAAMHPGGELLLLKYAGKDATDAFYSFHRQEVLFSPKYAKLVIGRIINEERKIDIQSPLALSSVPYAEPSAFQGFFSPYYTASHRAYRTAVRKFLAEEIFVDMSPDDSGKPATIEVYRKMGAAGILGANIGPGKHLKGYPQLGGVKAEEFDYFHELILHEEFSRLGYYGYIDSLFSGGVIGLPPVLNFGSKELQSRIVPDVLSGNKRICLAISEPHAGSDVAGMITTAVKTADGKHYVVNGVKKWITNGTFCDFFTTAVKTGNSFSMLLVERSAGLETKAIKTSHNSTTGTAYVIYENVLVPVENLIGKEGQGFPIIMSNFNHERWAMICGCVGASRRVVEECFLWANQRKVFGKSLLEQPVIRNKLALMVAELESIQNWNENLTFQMCQMSYAEQTKKLGGAIALGKLRATRMAYFIADQSVQIFGGRAITKTGMGRIVEGWNRVNKFQAILGGSEEILADLGVRMAMKAFPKGARL